MITCQQVLQKSFIACLLVASTLYPAKAQNAASEPPATTGETLPSVVVISATGEKDKLAKTRAAATTETAQPPKAAAAPPKSWLIAGSLRVRVENQNFFPTDKANGAYSFLGGAFRYGVTHQAKTEDFMLELEAPYLFGLPTKAIAPAPQGSLGHGANYFAANGNQVASVFLKQAWVRFKNNSAPGKNIRVGRFEIGDGLETTPTDANLAWVKQNRIAQRLIGTFGYTLVTRSFDGVQITSNSPHQNITALAFAPTRGAFDLNGMDTLPNIHVGYLALTIPQKEKKSSSDTRLFYLYYEDLRGQPVKTDNRPAAVRAADHHSIRISTIGANYARVMNLGQGKLDVMGWAAGQVGMWGSEKHGAYAAAGEVGYQMPRWDWHPWFRAGINFYSGDGNAANNQHGSFFPVLPTARIYARYPFYAESNLQDAFAQVILKPSSRLTLRSDVHNLRLAEINDLWYAGGGAFENQNFGFSGRTSSGHGDFATVYDLSADYQFSRSTAVTLYAAYANGGHVTDIFKSHDSIFGYAELNLKF